MAALATILREEFARLIRVELKKQLDDLNKSNKELRKEVSELRQKVKAIEKQSGIAVSMLRVKPLVADAVPLDALDRFKPTADAVKQVRKKLSISQVEMAALLGVTSQSISNWERHEGELSMRNATKTSFYHLKSMSKREALGQLSGNTPAE